MGYGFQGQGHSVISESDHGVVPHLGHATRIGRKLSAPGRHAGMHCRARTRSTSCGSATTAMRGGNQPLPAVRFERRQKRGGRRRRVASHDSQPRAAGGLAGSTATSKATLSSPRNIKTNMTMGARRNHAATSSSGAPACSKSRPINVDVARANNIRSQAALEFKNVIVPAAWVAGSRRRESTDGSRTARRRDTAPHRWRSAGRCAQCREQQPLDHAQLENIEAGPDPRRELVSCDEKERHDNS